MAFSTVARPSRIEGCPCCIKRKRVDVLLGKHLRDLTPDELAPYAGSAFLTVGDTADYLYFLPRILDISVIEPYWVPGIEITGRAISASGPAGWTQMQRRALDEFLEAVVEMKIREDADQLNSWMCAIAKLGYDVGPFLDRIAKSPEAVLAYFESNAADLPKGKLTNGFWERPCPAHDQIVDWFYSVDIARVPFEAYGYIMSRHR